MGLIIFMIPLANNSFIERIIPTRYIEMIEVLPLDNSNLYDIRIKTDGDTRYVLLSANRERCNTLLQDIEGCIKGDIPRLYLQTFEKDWGIFK